MFTRTFHRESTSLRLLLITTTPTTPIDIWKWSGIGITKDILMVKFLRRSPWLKTQRKSSEWGTETWNLWKRYPRKDTKLLNSWWIHMLCLLKGSLTQRWFEKSFRMQWRVKKKRRSSLKFLRTSRLKICRCFWAKSNQSTLSSIRSKSP